MGEKVNLRTFTVTPADQKDFDPFTFVQRMKSAGFKFDSEGCPIKFTRPCDIIEESDGGFTYRQWDDEDGIS